jgi:cell division septum initiation protein DivIVA
MVELESLEIIVKELHKLEQENKKLREKVETLELWLDNKEKLNEEYRKQIDKLRTDNIYEE